MPARTPHDWDRLETAAQEIINNPGPTLDETGEDIAINWDSDGKPIPDEHARRQARKLLDDIRQDRAEQTGTEPV